MSLDSLYHRQMELYHKIPRFMPKEFEKKKGRKEEVSKSKFKLRKCMKRR